jgi:hypothetical protein
MLVFHYNTSNPNTSVLQRMNNQRRDMYHDLVCEHRKLSTEHSRLRLDLSKKGKPSRHNLICRITLIFYSSQHPSCRHILMRRHITPCQHFSATLEEQVTELVKRVKELTGMPDPVNFQITTLHLKILLFLSLSSIFKSFLILLTSNPCR